MSKMKGTKIAASLLLAWAVGMFPAVNVQGQADENGYALLIQQSPVDGGTVEPGSGVHRFTEGDTLELTAKPRPGYRFLYWLGDVGDPGSVTTQVQLDSPKVVVAVYERDDFEDLMDAGPMRSVGGGAGGGLHGSSASISSSGGISGGSYPTPDTPTYNYSDGDPDDFTDDDDLVVPEPATLCLLGLGGCLLGRRKRS